MFSFKTIEKDMLIKILSDEKNGPEFLRDLIKTSSADEFISFIEHANQTIEKTIASEAKSLLGEIAQKAKARIEPYFNEVDVIEKQIDESRNRYQLMNQTLILDLVLIRRTVDQKAQVGSGLYDKVCQVFDDYSNNNDILKFLKNIKIKDNLLDMIRTEPEKMEKIYQDFLLLKAEQDKLENLQRELKNAEKRNEARMQLKSISDDIINTEWKCGKVNFYEIEVNGQKKSVPKGVKKIYKLANDTKEDPRILLEKIFAIANKRLVTKHNFLCEQDPETTAFYIKLRQKIHPENVSAYESLPSIAKRTIS